jgi:dTDP-L-rhamnose 4-epimerase
MRALVTGGAGFIGTKLGASLARVGHEVTVLDNLHPQIHGGMPTPEPPPGGQFVRGDVTEFATVATILQDGYEVILHLAAETGTGQSLDEASRHGLVNVVGTTRLLDALSRAKQHPAHFVLLSSRAIYGEGEWLPPRGGKPLAGAMRLPDDLQAGQWLPSGVPLGSTPIPSAAHRTVPAPTSVYGATKLAQEHVLRAWCGARHVPLSVLRLQNVYGRGQSPRNPYTGIMTLFARLAQAGDTVPVYEDGEIVRDFVHVNDVVSAIVAACDRIPAVQRVLDIGSGQGITVLEMAKIVTAAAGYGQPIITGEFRLGDVRAASCDITKAADDLGWNPSVALRDGVEDLLRWLGELSAARRAFA